MAYPTFWIDVETLGGVRVGDGPIDTATRLEYSPRLDESGTFSFTMPAGDAKKRHLRAHRVVRFMTMMDGTATQFGCGVVENIKKVVGSSPPMVEVSGNDLLRELVYAQTTGLSLVEPFEEDLGSGLSLGYYWEDDGYHSVEWTTFPQTVTMDGSDAPDYIYVRSATEFSAVLITMGSGNGIASELRGQFWNERAHGWANCTLEDGTAVAGMTLAQTGVVTVSGTDGWETFEDEGYVLRLYVSATTNSVTFTDISITRVGPTMQALAIIMTYAPAGWSLVNDEPNSCYLTTGAPVYITSPGSNVLACLSAVARYLGQHFRLGTGKTIEWLRNDTPDSGLEVIGRVAPTEMPPGDTRGIITDMTELEDSTRLSTRVYPYGGGEPERLTLRYTTRTAPAGYTLDINNNYIERDGAVTYLGGVVDLPIQDIRIQSSDFSNIQLQNASNQLFDWAMAQLIQNSATTDDEVPRSFTAKTLRVKQFVKPGDRVLVKYSEWRDGYEVLDINRNLVVLTPSYSGDVKGVLTARFTFATQAQWPQGDTNVIVDLIDQALAPQNGPDGGVGGAMSAHNIIGLYHWVISAAGYLVGVNPANTLALLSPTDLIEIWGMLGLGRYEGNHVAFIVRETPTSIEHMVEVTTSGGEQVFAAGYEKDVPNSFFVRWGPLSGPQITYTNDGSRDGIEKPGIWNIPVAALNLGGTADEIVTALPDAFTRPAGWRVALVNPSDPTTFVSYLRDNLDGWQLEQGPGYAQVHDHSSAETGGPLSIELKRDQHLFSLTGQVETEIGSLRLPNHTGGTLVINEVYADVNTAPTGADLIVDININGTTIFLTTAEQPKILAGEFVSAAAVPYWYEWGDGDYLTCDVDQVGSTNPGANLTVTIVFTK